jgi:sodium/proline symporter
MNYQVLIPFVAYFLLIIAIGVYSSRFSSKGIIEYFLGGRQMGRFVVALSAVVSGRSAWLLLGVSGLAYMQGLSAIWAILGYTLVEFLLFLYYAPRLRKFTEENDCITLPDFYAARFNDTTGVLRTLLVSIFILFMVAYISAQFAAGGKAFFAHFGISPDLGLVITAFIVLFYTLLGGFMAVSLTDVLQGIMMILALLFIPLLAFIKMGNMQPVSELVYSWDKSFLNPFTITGISAIGLLGIGLGSPGNPHILVRYMSIKDPLQFRWTAIVGTLWNLFMGLGAVLIGVAGRAYFPVKDMLPGADPENIFISLADKLMHPVVVGLILASVFAAIMSTADSQLLVAASSVVRDFYEKILNKGKPVSPQKLTRMSRVVVLVLVVLAILLGIYSSDLIFWFVLFAWGGLGAAIGPTSILALFWKRTTKAGVIAGLITGTLTVFIWKSIPMLDQFLYELIPGFIFSLLATLVVSFFTSGKSAE